MTVELAVELGAAPAGDDAPPLRDRVVAGGSRSPRRVDQAVSPGGRGVLSRGSESRRGRGEGSISVPVSIEVPACTVRCVRVRHEPAEVSSVRRALHDDLLRDPRTSLVADDVAVVTSELVGNAVRHGSPLDGGLLVRWRVTGDEVAVEVVDGGGGDGPPRELSAHDADPMDVCGRGLYIVEEIARRWGTTVDTAGHRTVWALVPFAASAVPERLGA
ncbi:ATP-binding protein [Quadrisphaera setariae]|uniref:ATP-binding protein n=1 Tax=Quadrisphaera setariae TaxID=2593304 RepID=A0A5C8Z2R3_9ACTN|nr:ATP-binding protein [Quadrisphaera setariae]